MPHTIRSAGYVLAGRAGAGGAGLAPGGAACGGGADGWLGSGVSRWAKKLSRIRLEIVATVAAMAASGLLCAGCAGWATGMAMAWADRPGRGRMAVMAP